MKLTLYRKTHTSVLNGSARANRELSLRSFQCTLTIMLCPAPYQCSGPMISCQFIIELHSGSNAFMPCKHATSVLIACSCVGGPMILCHIRIIYFSVMQIIAHTEREREKKKNYQKRERERERERAMGHGNAYSQPYIRFFCSEFQKLTLTI